MASQPRPCVTEISEHAFSCADVCPSNFQVCYLPLLFARGKPTSLESITEEELEKFLPYMIQCSLNHPYNAKILKEFSVNTINEIFSIPQPEWWFDDIPFEFPVRRTGQWKNKFAVLKSLVCRCYTFYDSEYILRLAQELTRKSSVQYHLVPDPDDMMRLYNGTTSLVKFWKDNLIYDSRHEPTVRSTGNVSSGVTGVQVTRMGSNNNEGEVEVFDVSDGQDIHSNFLSSVQFHNTSSHRKTVNQNRDESVKKSPNRLSLRIDQEQTSSTPSCSHNCGDLPNSSNTRPKRRRRRPSRPGDDDSDVSYPSVKHSRKRRGTQDFKDNRPKRPKRNQYTAIRESHSEPPSELFGISSHDTSNVHGHLNRPPLGSTGVKCREVPPLNLAKDIAANDPENDQNSQEGVLGSLGLYSAAWEMKKQPALKKKSKKLSKWKLSNVYNTVDISSDLGRQYLQMVKPMTCTSNHIDKIEKFVNHDNKTLLTRSFDTNTGDDCSSISSFNDSRLNPADVPSGSSSEVHNPRTTTHCSTRFYKFYKCRRCKRNKHETLETCDCEIGNTEVNVQFCFVQLENLSADILDSLSKKGSVKTFNKNSVTDASSSIPSGMSMKKVIEVIDLTLDDSEEDVRTKDSDKNATKFITKSHTKHNFRENASNSVEHENYNFNSPFPLSSYLTNNYYEQGSSKYGASNAPKSYSFSNNNAYNHSVTNYFNNNNNTNNNLQRSVQLNQSQNSNDTNLFRGNIINPVSSNQLFPGKTINFLKSNEVPHLVKQENCVKENKGILKPNVILFPVTKETLTISLPNNSCNSGCTLDQNKNVLIGSHPLFFVKDHLNNYSLCIKNSTGRVLLPKRVLTECNREVDNKPSVQLPFSVPNPKHTAKKYKNTKKITVPNRNNVTINPVSHKPNYYQDLNTETKGIPFSNPMIDNQSQHCGTHGKKNNVELNTRTKGIPPTSTVVSTECHKSVFVRKNNQNINN